MEDQIFKDIQSHSDAGGYTGGAFKSLLSVLLGTRILFKMLL